MMPQIRVVALIPNQRFHARAVPLFHRALFAAGGNDFANS
jgi:hypothetical protein